MTALAEVVLSADTLPLPEGVNYASYVPGMREIITYQVGYDTFVARWDTIIEGKQYAIGKVSPTGTVANPIMPVTQWAASQRDDSRAQLIRAFHDGKPSIAGTPIYFIPVSEQKPGRVA